MHTTCFQKQDTETFSCETKDLITFHCKCRGFNTNSRSFFSSEFTSSKFYFPVWLDIEGPPQKNRIFKGGGYKSHLI